MTTRFLSFVALAGMLVAAGCSGGGAGSSLAPASPSLGSGSSTGTSGGTGSITESFSVPIASSASTSSSSRKAAYISPGSLGLQVFLGNGIACTSGGASGTAQIISTVNPVAANASTTINLTPGSFSGTPIVGQTLTLTNTGQGNTGAPSPTSNFTITNVQANGSILTGSFAAAVTAAYLPSGTLVTFNTSGGAGCQQAIIGSFTAPQAIASAGGTFPLPSATYGFTSGAQVVYSFGPSAQLGYYNVTMTISGLTAKLAAAGYVLGVVITDTSNNNFVLSEGQSGINGAGIAVTANGPAVANLTLNPVVNSYIAATPVLVNTQVKQNFANAALNSYETTIFPVDERGFVIPNQFTSSNLSTINSVPDNAPAAAPFVSIAGTGLTFGVWTSSVAAGSTAATGVALVNAYTLASTLTAQPPNVVSAAVPSPVTIGNTAANVVDSIGNYLTIAQPVATGLPVISAAANAIQAGIPLNIACTTATAPVNIVGTITSVVNNTVVGYTYTPGTNYPAATIPASLGSVNCSPGIASQVN